MAHALHTRRLCSIVSVWIPLACVSIAAADPVVWTGPMTSFSKEGSEDPAIAENQDRLTDNVWLTRAGAMQGGIFNIAPVKETGYVSFTSPADTQWATEAMPANAGKTIAATNHAQLAFADWAPAYGGPGFGLGVNITTINAVVHLVTDDLYLDLMFTQFDSTGLVTYNRSTPAPVPTGDYNNDGVVDAADYVVWRKTLNQSATPAGNGADGNQSGTIDDGDFTHWRERYGNVVPSSGTGASSPIPEPTAAALAFMGLLFLPLGYSLRVLRYAKESKQ